MRIQLRQKEHQTPRCAFCHDDLTDDDVTKCLACDGPHHVDCWADHGACAACFHSRCDRPREARERAKQFRTQRTSRLQARNRRTRARQGTSNLWISVIFSIEVLLAFLVVVLGVFEGHAWVVVAYLVQGVALAIYFASADTLPGEAQNQNRRDRQQRRRRRRQDQQEEVEDGIDEPSQPPAFGTSLSDRIRIRAVTGRVVEDLDAGEQVVGSPIGDRGPDVAEVLGVDRALPALATVEARELEALEAMAEQLEDFEDDEGFPSLTRDDEQGAPELGAMEILDMAAALGADEAEAENPEPPAERRRSQSDRTPAIHAEFEPVMARDVRERNTAPGQYYHPFHDDVGDVDGLIARVREDDSNDDSVELNGDELHSQAPVAVEAANNDNAGAEEEGARLEESSTEA